MLKKSVSIRLFKPTFVLLVLASAATYAATSKVSGKVTGFGTLTTDDVIDGALVIPSMKASEILSFQLAGLMGPDEKMSVGPISSQVPGNLFFPSQREKYGFLPLTIAKESFTLMMEPGAQNELVAIRFQAPFNKAADLGRAKAPYTELVPLVSLKNFALGSLRDWTAEPTVNLNIAQAYTKTTNFSWTRPAAAANQFDMIVPFQKTPAGRWMPTDLVAKPTTTGRMATGAGLQPDMKVMMVRITNDANSNPQSAVGWFKSGTTADSYVTSDVPKTLSGALMKGDTVTWDPISEPGWMAVLRSVTSAQQILELGRKSELETAFSTLGDFGFSKLLPKFSTILFADASHPLEAWVSAAAGAYQLTSPLAQNESLSLLFVGADREVPMPDAKDDEPALFTYATELRMLVVK